MTQFYHHHPSSYRDPSGFIFEKKDVLYRQVNKIFKEDYDFFINSGCYDHLAKKGLLLPHETINENLTGSSDYYKTLQPETIRFISYPYEWSFDMLKDAALLTLKLLKESVGYGLILKDATPYNIQWHRGKLIFIDTLSFEKYNEQEPWIAYRQFCENFLAPLLLMHYSKNSLQQILLAYPEGIPLAIIRSLLPWRSRLSLHTYLHIHMHAAIAQKNADTDQRKVNFSKQKLLNLVTSLETLINKLKLSGQKSAWSDYYAEASQREDYLAQKKQLVKKWISNLDEIRTAADLGANDGAFSRLLAGQQVFTLVADFDPLCINNLYKDIRQNNQVYLEPLVLDLSNPSPAIGVNNTERPSFISRIHVDLVLALAVIHHLVIGKNIPFDKMAELFKQLGNYLIIEYVPKTDEKIQLMLKSKKDIYSNYTSQDFENAFIKYFTILDKKETGNSGRVLYLMKRNG